HGGGIYCGSNSSFTLSNSTISNNTSTRMGGGIFIESSSSGFEISDVIITENICTGYSGGGIIVLHATANITNCIISHNTAQTGGSGGSSLYANTTWNNCLFYENQEPSGGDAYAASQSSESVFINSTFADNKTGSTINIGYGADIIFINSILWNEDIPEISWNNYTDSVNTVTFLNTAVEGGQAEIDSFNNVMDQNIANWLTGNIDTYPVFADSANDDYSLADLSPVISAAASTVTIDGVTYTAPTTDLEGNPRPSPANTYPDMG
ncbi:uncharacterized protein METZ01_LOCUS433363, partial [marine metagenome]